MTSGPFEPHDDLVELTRVEAFEAEVVAVQLRAAGVPAAVFGVGTAGQLSAVQFTQGSRVMVRRSDLSEAERIVSELFPPSGGTVVSDEVLSDLATHARVEDHPDDGAVV